MTRADVVVVRGGAAIVVPGDRAHDVLTACGVVIAPTLPAGKHRSTACHGSVRMPKPAAGLLVEHGRST